MGPVATENIERHDDNAAAAEGTFGVCFTEHWHRGTAEKLTPLPNTKEVQPNKIVMDMGFTKFFVLVSGHQTC